MKNAKHLFIIAPGIFGSASKEDIEATAEGLKEVGLFQMPYERDVFLQISALEVVGAYANPNHDVVYGPFGANQKVGMALHDRGTGATTTPDPFDFPESVADLEMILIVLLATKNAEKRTAECKMAKLGIGKSHRHRFAYTTTISMPHDLPADTDNPPKGGKMSPHLRRGHIRRQHYGSGNQLEKKVWIAPVFVNADPDFVATRRGYKISGPIHLAA